MTTTYQGGWEVPDHLMPATALGELEYPRTADGQQPLAWVEARDWSDPKTSIPLCDARACPPSKATARQLAAAAARSGRRRRCVDCDARCQRPLPPLDADDPRPCARRAGTSRCAAAAKPNSPLIGRSSLSGPASCWAGRTPRSSRST